MSADSPEVLADRYALEDLLGRGGMADVHRATDRVLGRPVAVKVLRDTADEETDRLRFTAEARTLAGLSHPGLVMVLDAGTTAERPYLVMELVEGQTLARCCAGQALDPARVAAIGTQLADALAYAHARGVVHRDVKPGNVLLGESDRVKLADFGIAKIIGDTVRHTRTGHAIGTAAYLSPEQVRGEEVTPAVDVYSLGLVLLESLTGERAFPGSPTESALARLTRDPEIPTSLTAPWRELLAAMTASDAPARPTAEDAATRLRELAAAPEPITEPVSGPDPMSDPTSDRTRTRLLSQPVPVTPAAQTTAASSGDRLSTWVRRTRARVGQVPEHVRGVVGAVLAILVLVVVVAIAADTDSGDPSGNRTGGRSGPADPVPSGVPAPLQQPLTDLHDAVGGSGQ